MTQHDAARVERGPITEVKHFALGMADLLERQGFTVAAAELRRLHAENEAFGIHLSERMKDLAKVEAQRDALLGGINGVLAAERSEGGGCGGFINTPPTREHQRRVAQAWQELHAVIKSVEDKQ